MIPTTDRERQPQPIPGPYIVFDGDEQGEDIEIRNQAALIATVHNYYSFPCLGFETEEEAEREHAMILATARLFAAAPDLLHACRLAARYHGVGDVDPLYTARTEDVEHFLVTAIQKAEGGAS